MQQSGQLSFLNVRRSAAITVLEDRTEVTEIMQQQNYRLRQNALRPATTKPYTRTIALERSAEQNTELVFCIRWIHPMLYHIYVKDHVMELRLFFTYCILLVRHRNCPVICHRTGKFYVHVNHQS